MPNRAEDPLPAGDFSSWLEEIKGALRGERASDVPCGECTACCTSSQFVHIGPEETDTLAHIPAELLFPAPGLPEGHVLLGYDDKGHCPMLADGACSIYEHRPRTCRTYDCRVFAATGISPEDDTKPLIALRVRRWQFNFPTDEDRAQRTAIAAAATFLQDRAEDFTDAIVPADATRLAVLAIRVHGAFLQHDAPAGHAAATTPSVDAVEAEVVRATRPPDTG